MTDEELKKMSFEDAMKALEDVVGQLEGGDVPLEQSITLYERGAKLKDHCAAKLREAQEKVEALTVGRDGQPNGTAPFEGT